MWRVLTAIARRKEPYGTADTMLCGALDARKRLGVLPAGGIKRTHCQMEKGPVCACVLLCVVRSVRCAYACTALPHTADLYMLFCAALPPPPGVLWAPKHVNSYALRQPPLCARVASHTHTHMSHAHAAAQYQQQLLLLGRLAKPATQYCYSFRPQT